MKQKLGDREEKLKSSLLKGDELNITIGQLKDKNELL